MTFKTLDDALKHYNSDEFRNSKYVTDDFTEEVWRSAFEQGYMSGKIDGIEEEGRLCHEHCEQASNEERNKLRNIIEILLKDMVTTHKSTYSLLARLIESVA